MSRQSHRRSAVRAYVYARSTAFCSLLVLVVLTVGCYSTPRRPDGGEGLLAPGVTAPDLEAYDVGGTPTRLSSLRGRTVVVYFYPRDGTPGCTHEACAFRDAWLKLKEANIAVIGVSSQSRDSHLEFQKENRLPFPLVADEQGRAQRAYGVSTGLFGDARVSFLVAPSGAIVKVWPNVDPATHVDQVLAEAARLQSR
jgi:thioredoxin-dependent peroxiredoxin